MLPRYSQKHQLESLVTPQRLIESNRRLATKIKVPENIILSFLPRPGSMLPGHEIKGEKFFGAQFDILKNVGVLSQFGIGAPAVAMYVELLVALGARKIISVGMAGALSKEIKLGGAVLCSKAYRDEGTSFHYAVGEDFAFPAEDLNLRLRNSAKAEEINLSEVPTWTTDALFRETSAEAKKYNEMGMKTVDMEASALFTVAKFLNVQAASLFVVTDCLFGADWKIEPQNLKAKFKTLLQMAVSSLNVNGQPQLQNRHKNDL